MSLKINQLSLGYGALRITQDLSLDLDTKDFIAIIGPNGCGKSTLLRGLTGALTPETGDVLLDDKNVANWPLKELAQRLVYLPQNPEAPDGLTLKQIVEHGRFAHHGLFSRKTDEDAELVDQAIAQTGLSDLSDRMFSTLSGGERQRGWIALALAQNANLFLLDEPTTYLDIGHQAQALDLLKQLNKDREIGVIVVLHDINHAATYADRILAMKDGEIIADGAPNDIISVELIKELFGVEVKIIAVEMLGQNKPHCIAVPNPNSHSSNSVFSSLEKQSLPLAPQNLKAMSQNDGGTP